MGISAIQTCRKQRLPGTCDRHACCSRHYGLRALDKPWHASRRRPRGTRAARGQASALNTLARIAGARATTGGKTTGGSYGAESIAKALRCPSRCPGYDQREWEIWKPPASE
ncbi:hypothetical protein DF3PB_2360004 [uncultured Defluviicoccus sp.]|uniref:Uncharacterized protein n=1 Tax=metagenome TaxID=256318 RepID=A0A380TD70_9ZZZZ|nr:hypothetical protein DF3PB_2360004 [uncultured Defluviicoccus sp.]